MRELGVITLAAAVALSCASTRTAGGGEDGEPRPAAPSASPEVRLLKSIAAAKKHWCTEKPAELSEGYAVRAREAYDGLESRCESPRCRRALRDLDDCVVAFEQEESQIPEDLGAVLDGERARLKQLRADDLFARLVQKHRTALEEADSAAQDWKAARETAEATELRFRLETWDAAEQALLAAREELLEALRRAEIDPRHARTLGLW